MPIFSACSGIGEPWQAHDMTGREELRKEFAKPIIDASLRRRLTQLMESGKVQHGRQPCPAEVRWHIVGLLIQAHLPRVRQMPTDKPREFPKRIYRTTRPRPTRSITPSSMKCASRGLRSSRTRSPSQNCLLRLKTQNQDSHRLQQWPPLRDIESRGKVTREVAPPTPLDEWSLACFDDPAQKDLRSRE